MRTGLLLLVVSLAACTERPVDATTPATTGGTTAAPSTTDLPTGPPDPTSTSAATPTTGTTTTGTTMPPDEDTSESFDCGEALLAIPIVPADIVIALDRTGSMVAEGSWWDHDADPATPTQARWRSVHAAVDAFLTTYDAALNPGLVLFASKLALPEYGPPACAMGTAVDVPISPENAATILAALPPADSDDLVGATPIRRAVELARAELDTIATGNPAHILLLTDGAANCIADAPDNATLLETHDPALLPAVADALAADITTHVVGLAIPDVTSDDTKDGAPDDTNPYAALHALAQAGGAPLPGDVAFHDATDEPALFAAFTAIAAEILPCTDIALAPAPKYPDHVELVIGGSDYPEPLADCDGQDGWRWTDETRTAIDVCGPACEAFRRDGGLDARYRCPNDA